MDDNARVRRGRGRRGGRGTTGTPLWPRRPRHQSRAQHTGHTRVPFKSAGAAMKQARLAAQVASCCKRASCRRPPAGRSPWLPPRLNKPPRRSSCSVWTKEACGPAGRETSKAPGPRWRAAHRRRVRGALEADGREAGPRAAAGHGGHGRMDGSLTSSKLWSRASCDRELCRPSPMAPRALGRGCGPAAPKAHSGSSQPVGGRVGSRRWACRRAR